MKISASNTLAEPCTEAVRSLTSPLMVDAERKHIRYISRVACLTSMTKTPFPWEGPVSKEFLAFNSMVLEYQSNLRDLIEMVLLALFVHGDAEREKRANSEYSKIAMRCSSVRRHTNLVFLLGRS